MASSGSLLTNGWYSSSKGDYVYLEFAWSVSGTSIENNQKTIYWELRGKRSASGYVTCGGFEVVIDGGHGNAGHFQLGQKEDLVRCQVAV